MCIFDVVSDACVCVRVRMPSKLDAHLRNAIFVSYLYLSIQRTAVFVYAIVYRTITDSLPSHSPSLSLCRSTIFKYNFLFFRFCQHFNANTKRTVVQIASCRLWFSDASSTDCAEREEKTSNWKYRGKGKWEKRISRSSLSCSPFRLNLNTKSSGFNGFQSENETLFAVVRLAWPFSFDVFAEFCVCHKQFTRLGKLLAHTARRDICA